MPISFQCTDDEAALVDDIADRAMSLAAEFEFEERTAKDWKMDVIATHANGCRLRLDELLAADDANFGHDVFGIARYLNRITGTLDPVFWPRFAEAAAR